MSLVDCSECAQSLHGPVSRSSEEKFWRREVPAPILQGESRNYAKKIRRREVPVEDAALMTEVSLSVQRCLGFEAEDARSGDGVVDAIMFACIRVAMSG